MQFFWVYIDDLMGKGLSIWVILELLFYVSASLIPLALPLAILLSSLMTFGNMSENNELTALKSNGFSLVRIMRPLTVVVLFIAGFTFYFANYVIPVSNLKWHSLIYDIQNTKLSSLIVPGVYTTEIDGYAIKVNKGKDTGNTEGQEDGANKEKAIAVGGTEADTGKRGHKVEECGRNGKTGQPNGETR